MVGRLSLLTAVTLTLFVAVNVEARVGERTTVCAGPGLESGSPDECDGVSSKPATLTPGRRVVFRLFCLESPGETCRGLVIVRSITSGVKQFRPNKRFLYSLPAGTEGKKVGFRISRRLVKKLGYDVTMGVEIYAYEPNGRLICSSSDELFVRKAKKKKPKTTASAAFPTPDERCFA